LSQASDKLIAPTSQSAVRRPTAPLQPPSLQDYLKKYQFAKVLIPTLSTSKGYEIASYPLVDLFRSDVTGVVTSPIGTPASYRSTKGLFTHLTALFKQFKGGLRFKISDAKANGDIDTLQVYYGPTVYRPNNYDPINTTAISTKIASQLPSATGDSYPWLGVTPSPVVLNPTRLPVTIYGGASCRVGEFEVPFTSIFNSILIGDSNLDFAETQFGSITVVRPVGDATMRLNLHVSFSDEARVGNLYCVPYVCPVEYGLPGTGIPTSIDPDRYLVTSGGTNTLIIL